MELWIRSQDKELLLKVDLVSVDAVIEEDGEYDIRFHNIVLGRYENKKRALEVLDEIQNLLNPMLVFKNCNCTQEMLDNIKKVGTCVVSDNAHIEQIQTCIYEMPEE